MELLVKPVTRKSKEVKKIYKSSFPKEERMPFWLMLIMAKGHHTEFLSFYDNTTLCGFAYLAIVDNIVFIMYFAVSENVRSKGYGSQILEKIQSLYPNHKIIISIEKCNPDADNIEQRLKRRQFYLRNGYNETGYLIELEIEQEILIKHGEFDKEEFAEFFKKYSNGSMKPRIWKAIAT